MRAANGCSLTRKSVLFSARAASEFIVTNPKWASERYEVVALKGCAGRFLFVWPHHGGSCGLRVRGSIVIGLKKWSRTPASAGAHQVQEEVQLLPNQHC
jgi:hypothetical protein